MSILLAWGLFFLSSNISWAQAVKVEVVQHDGKFQLLRDGEPYRINGTGLANADLTRLAAHGGNSIRTWSTVDGPDGTAKLLDDAHELGITVSLCLYTGSARHGFDYYDQAAVARQHAEIKKEVLK